MKRSEFLISDLEKALNDVDNDINNQFREVLEKYIQRSITAQEAIDKILHLFCSNDNIKSKFLLCLDSKKDFHNHLSCFIKLLHCFIQDFQKYADLYKFGFYVSALFLLDFISMDFFKQQITNVINKVNNHSLESVMTYIVSSKEYIMCITSERVNILGFDPIFNGLFSKNPSIIVKYLIMVSISSNNDQLYRSILNAFKGYSDQKISFATFTKWINGILPNLSKTTKDFLSLQIDDFRPNNIYNQLNILYNTQQISFLFHNKFISVLEEYGKSKTRTHEHHMSLNRPVFDPTVQISIFEFQWKQYYLTILDAFSFVSTKTPSSRFISISSAFYGKDLLKTIIDKPRFSLLIPSIIKHCKTFGKASFNFYIQHIEQIMETNDSLCSTYRVYYRKLYSDSVINAGLFFRISEFDFTNNESVMNLIQKTRIFAEKVSDIKDKLELLFQILSVKTCFVPPNIAISLVSLNKLYQIEQELGPEFSFEPPHEKIVQYSQLTNIDVVIDSFFRGIVSTDLAEIFNHNQWPFTSSKYTHVFKVTNKQNTLCFSPYFNPFCNITTNPSPL